MSETIKIVNYKQISMYIKHGAKPINIFYDRTLVFEFDREETRELYDKWCKYELK